MHIFGIYRTPSQCSLVPLCYYPYPFITIMIPLDVFYLPTFILYSRPICASSPMPHWPCSLVCPWISSSSAGVKLPSSSLLDRKLAASLVRRDRCVPPVVRRRSDGPDIRNRLADFDDVLSTETASSSSLEPSLEPSLLVGSGSVVVSGPEVESAEAESIFSELSVETGTGRAGNSGGGGEAGSFDTSTSSASRYHFRRRVQRPQPSFPRRPFCHCLPVSLGDSPSRILPR